MKIAIIGNSHAGPVYTAWKEYKKQGGVLRAEFFIERSLGTEPLVLAPAGGQDVVIEDMKILPEPRLPVDEFDAFIIIGLGFGTYPVAALYRQVRSDEHKQSPDTQLLSDTCFQETVRDVLADTKAVRVAESLRSLTKVPIYIVPQPHSAWWVGSLQNGAGKLYRDIEQNGDAELILRDYRAAAFSLTPATVLAQPDNTVAGGLYTGKSFTLGDPDDRSEGSGFARGDYYHGNVAWASEVTKSLDSILL